MPEEALTITVSDQADIDWIRSKVRDGRFSSEEDALCYGICLLREQDEERETWLRTIGKARYESYKANPHEVYSVEELQQHLAERRAARAEKTTHASSCL